jgi:UDP-N-acetylglucosamine 2-epimerase
MKIAVFVGTRPEIIKMAPVIREIFVRKEVESIFVHTGQHYDWDLSDRFLQELGLPDPSVFLNVRSGSHGEQTARIMIRSEKVLREKTPELVLVEGDTNSALGVALSSAKLRIKIGHIEAGCRSFDKTMPEEINRIVIGRLADLHFAATSTAVNNLLREGVPRNCVFLTGHPLVDLINEVRSKISSSDAIQKLGVENKEFYFLTLHREENVDHEKKLRSILSTITEMSKERTIVFSIHPRTSKMVKKFRFGRMLRNVIVTTPLGYIDTLNLVEKARLVLTDSGGLQQEAALLRTPCVTLRKTTEWVETVTQGLNILAGTGKNKILETVKFIESSYTEITENFIGTSNIFGSLGSSKRIVDLAIEHT